MNAYLETEMSDTKDNMVLRTVYLPLALDRELRQLAFTRDVSKADLIRDFILKGMGSVHASGERTLSEKVQERIDLRRSVVTKALASATKKKSKSPPTSRAKSAQSKARA
jgi:hypothetical protein